MEQGILMLNFKSFLKESTLLSEEMLLEANHTKDVENDDKGKMHELLLAKYLHPDSSLPEHHRSESENDEHAGTPTQVHDRLKKKMGDSAYHQIDQHAQQTAKEIKKHLDSVGHTGNGHHIGRVFWTSNADKPGKPGDHEKTTGVKDVNSNADVIVRMHDKSGKTVGHVGVSAKYGSQKPNYRNPGLESMEKTAGLEKGSLKKLGEAHHKYMEEIGYNGPATQRHVQYKIDKMGIDKIRAEHSKFEGLLAKGKTLSSKNKMMHEHLSKYIEAHDSMKPNEQIDFEHKAQARASTAEASALQAKRSMAKHFSEGLAKKSDDELRDIVRQHVSAPTHIPHVVAHSQVKDDGSAVSHVVPSHNIADDHLSQFENLHAVHNGGISTVIKGTHKATGKKMNVGTFTMKGSSGPHKGVAGTFSLS
jgi:hypothetical protein